eukprot:835980-Pleurochrysis_carterae.AAC.1
MACPDGEMTNAEHLYSMSFEESICGTKGLTQRQFTYRVGLIRSYDTDPTQRGFLKGWQGKFVRRLSEDARQLEVPARGQ